MIDDKNDFDYVPEEEIGVKRSITFKNARFNGKRFEVSDRALAIIINCVLDDLGKNHLLVSKSGIERWNEQDGIETLEKYEQELKGLACIKFDGGTEKVATGHNQYVPRHLLTLMKEGFETPSPKYLNHDECGKTGKAMAKCVISEIDNTNSRETIVALGCGKFIFKPRSKYPVLH